MNAGTPSGLGFVKGIREKYVERCQFVDVGIAEENAVSMASGIAKKVKEELDLEITVINPRFLTGLDIELLKSLKENHQLIITIEDGELIGGYGQNIAFFYGESLIKVKNYEISKEFHFDFNPEELLVENGMSVQNLVDYIKNLIC